MPSMIYGQDVPAICLLSKDHTIDDYRQLKELTMLCLFVLWTISVLITLMSEERETESERQAHTGIYYR